ncbi:MAG: FIST N-terminal domain-containing protein [Sideroxydans sp.]|nr:FIST N-terminal domain-containing protein [Sideroxydans sp.]
MGHKDALHYLPSITPAELDDILSRWQSAYPQAGLCALLPEAEKDKLPLLQTACRNKALPLVGGIFPALLEGGVFRTQGVWLLRFDRMPPTMLLEDLPTDAEATEARMREVCASLVSHLNGTAHATLFMLFDAMQPNIGSILDALYLNLANRVHYAGVNAGSETFQPMPCLFDAERVIGNGALFMLIPDHQGAILEHGYHAPTRTVYATSTEGNRIAQIDWRPAFEVYQELVREQYGIEIDQQNFYEHAVHFPFGIVRANHHVVVRIPVALNDDGSLFCVGEVPANSVLTLLERPEVDTHETLRVLMDGLQAMGDGKEGDDLLLFYCAGRRMHLGMEQATAELQEFSSRTSPSNIAGALSLGEIGGSTLHGYPLFHNATLVVARW